MRRQISLLGTILVGLVCLTIVQAEQNPEPKPLRFWSGKYLHSSRKFELILEQSPKEKNLLAADVVQVPFSRAVPVLRCFARVKDHMAVFQAPHDPGCQIQFRQTDDGIFVSDNCNGRGEESGFYTMVR